MYVYRICTRISKSNESWCVLEKADFSQNLVDISGESRSECIAYRRVDKTSLDLSVTAPFQFTVASIMVYNYRLWRQKRMSVASVAIAFHCTLTAVNVHQCAGARVHERLHDTIATVPRDTRDFDWLTISKA